MRSAGASARKVVVDEAPLRGARGDAFRPSYQQIGQFVASLPRRPVLCAMTATADKQLQRGIVQSLGCGIRSASSCP